MLTINLKNIHLAADHAGFLHKEEILKMGEASKKAFVLFLLFSFALTPVAPVVQVYAQETDQEIESLQPVTEYESDTSGGDGSDTSNPDVDVPDSTPEVVESEQTEEMPSVDIDPIVPSEEDQEQGLDPTIVNESLEEEVASTTEDFIPTGEKFKKNPDLSVEEQLAAVREHLLREGLPQVALDRLDAYETFFEEGPKEKGFFRKIWDFVTGNTEAAKEQRAIENLINSAPFKVESFSGKINTAPAERYERDFAGAKEQSNLIQKLKNFFQNGSTSNTNPYNVEDKKINILSSLLGPSKVMADVSDDPEEYLDEGSEIKFSQAIKDKAAELGGDPLAILNFVKNNIEYVPYYGSKKGADGTLTEFAGNDTDQSALLIALLRESDIPARYRQVTAKFDVPTINNLLGVTNATSSAELMSLQKIPYTMYTLNDDPYFFVVEHTYIEAYIPYGVSRGADLDDGGDAHWVPMDPSIATYLYSQPIDVGGGMRGDGFDIEDFFDDYLQGVYGTSTEPLAAYKTEVESWLALNPPPDNDPFTYDEAMMRRYAPDTQILEFIPGSLPFEISADLDTYDFIPNSLRHTVEFSVTHSSTPVLEHTAYLSDLADREIILTYDPATPQDKDIVDGFETIYDVVPLSLVAVLPKLKVGGDIVATGTATSTMGHTQSYEMEFFVPTRTMGSSVVPLSVDEFEKGIITGTSEGIALNTDRIVPSIMRPTEDTETTSFATDQVLYKTAVDYLYRLQSTHRELARVLGSDFGHIATKASISNGIEVINSMSQPYSFEWKGLRIDAGSSVRYFSRTHATNRNHNRDEFMGLFGLQSSQDESDIFEDNFEIESVATVKGLKLVADGEFPSISLVKINSSNQGDIDTLSVSTSTKNAFHTAVGNGRTIYTPSASITYDDWEGLFYIAVDFAGGDGTYAIGEGLNGGYTVTQWPNNWQNFWRYSRLITPGLTASINYPSPNSSYIRGKENIYWEVEYDSWTVDWVDKGPIDTTQFPIQKITLYTGYRTNESVDVNITKGTNTSTPVCISVLDGNSLPATSGKIGKEMHLPLWIDRTSGIFQERYNGYKQYNRQDDIHSHPTKEQFFTKLTTYGDTVGNINNPWIDPATGEYWDMSVDYGSFAEPAEDVEHEKYYMNMKWTFPSIEEKKWWYGKKVWIFNPSTQKAIVTGVLENGPAVSTGRVAGASPEAMKAIGAVTDDTLEYCWASDQNLPYGKVVTYTP